MMDDMKSTGQLRSYRKQKANGFRLWCGDGLESSSRLESWSAPLEIQQSDDCPQTRQVGVALLGLCIAGALAGYLMQQEMFNARVEQTYAFVDMARNMAAGLQKEVDAGKITKEQAIAEFGRRGNTLTYDNGSGYLFAYTMEGITVLAPDPSFLGKNRFDVLTNGRAIARELRDGVAAKGEVTLYYDNKRPGQEALSRKLGYAVARFPAGICLSARESISTISTPSCGR
jgi:hypothetical protein